MALIELDRPERPGIVIANLGSPATPKKNDVQRFLTEFLEDPYVVDLPTPLRQLLVRGIIAPFRSSKSATAYSSIWHCEGGPLRKFTSDVAQELERVSGIQTVVGMRYGEPSLKQAFETLTYPETDGVVVIPLYPQFSVSTWKTTVEHVFAIPPQQVIEFTPRYYDRPGYLNALENHVKSRIDADVEHLIVSFHSLPIRQIKKTDGAGHCLMQPDCCAGSFSQHETCYRHQCLVTAGALGHRIGIPFTISFQSKLGRQKWLEPATAQVIADLARKGVKKVAITCPSFPVDNLETLEEIAIQGKHQFETLGGKELQFIPSLNSNPDWIQFLSDFVHERLEHWPTSKNRQNRATSA